MSRYLAYPDVVFRDRQLLLASLAELGFVDVEEGDDLPLFGYHGDQRPETAALVVRRQYIGVGSNDLGFPEPPTATTRLSASTTGAPCSRASFSQ